MTIQQIKQHLTLQEVLHHYGIQVNKNRMTHCVFHEDKTASLQVNLEQNFYTCHACGKKGDMIQFVEDYEKISKHEAIVLCKKLIGNYELSMMNYSENQSNTIKQIEKIDFLTSIFETFRKGLFNSPPAREYCEKRALDYKTLEIGYNSGQFHHRNSKGEEFIKNCVEIGLLIDKNIVSKQVKNYQVFGKNCVVFSLKNKDNQIVSLYFRSILTPSSNEENKLPVVAHRHFYLKNRQGIYPNYPNPNTKKLILTESIIDAASLLQIENLKSQISNLNTNYSIIACYGTNGLNDEILNAIKELKNLEEIIFAFDNDEAGRTATANYTKLLKTELKNVKITSLELPNKDVNETLQLHNNQIFIKLLEERKPVKTIEKSVEFIQKSIEKVESLDTQKINKSSEIDILTEKKLVQKINELIGKSGIVGEENARMLLFLIVLSYLNKNPLHALVQGSSGSGKTHLISRIADLMPPEDVLRFTRITESSLYNWGEFDLFKKVIIIEDLDGLKEEALYALRELISNQILSSLTSLKDKKGNNKSANKIVKGQFSSLSATTKGETYEDNMNRSFVIAMNESDEQTQQIIDYQNLRIAGKIGGQDEKQAILFLQKLVRQLKPYEVVNPYAIQLQLPHNVKNKRRLNEMFQAIIKQITLLNQYQRQVAPGGNYLITEIEDIEHAVEILFDSILLKIDELDGSLRQFLEKIKLKLSDKEFTRFEAMEVTGFKKSQLQVYLNELVQFGYLRQFGFANKGFKYKIGYNDDIQKVREDLKRHFHQIIEKLKLETNGN